METCSTKKKKMQEGAKEAKKGMRKEDYRKSIVFEALHILKSGNRESSGSNSDGKKKQNTTLFILNRRNTASINLDTTRQFHTITPKSTLKKSIHARGLAHFSIVFHQN